MRKSIFIFLLSAVLTTTTHAFPADREIQFEHLSIGEGLSQSSVYCILQDSRGFMWLAAFDGLNKYDGCRFTVYAYEPGNPGALSHPQVWGLLFAWHQKRMRLELIHLIQRSVTVS